MVSVGGDGMLSSLAGLVSAGGGTLGVVPAGRGNDFARMLGLPDDPAGEARRAARGRRSAGSTCVALAVPAAARGWWPARSTPASTRAPPRSSTAAHWLPRPAAVPLRRRPRRSRPTGPRRYRVSVDGVEREYAAATVVVANSGYYGKGMKIAPAAAVDDGAARRGGDRGGLQAAS